MEEVTVKVGSIPNIKVIREQLEWYHDDVYQGKKDYGIVEDEKRSWIIFLDANGRPETYCGERDELGGCTGPMISLS